MKVETNIEKMVVKHDCFYVFIKGGYAIIKPLIPIPIGEKTDAVFGYPEKEGYKWLWDGNNPPLFIEN